MYFPKTHLRRTRILNHQDTLPMFIPMLSFLQLMTSFPEKLRDLWFPDLFFPSQRNAVVTQQPLQNCGEAAARRTKHAHHASSHPKRLQQQPLGVRALHSSCFGSVNFCFKVLFYFAVFCSHFKGLSTIGLFYRSTFSTHSFTYVITKCNWNVFCLCRCWGFLYLNFSKTLPFIIQWWGWR